MEETTQLTEEQKKQLLSLVRETIREYLTTGKRKEFHTEDEALLQKSGAFVTLKKKGDLRGCIGYIISDLPLYQTVIDAAISAATRDPRFLPLESDELDQVTLEISVLSPPKVITNAEEIEVGKHGLILTQGLNRGLLLPQVAIEQGWDRLTFLQHTCFKAGLPSDAWEKGAIMEVFSAHVFGEEEEPS